MIGPASWNILSRRGLPSAKAIYSRFPSASLRRRHFSAKAIYSTFPANLHYYSPDQKSSLYDHREIDSRPDDLFDEGVVVEKDGLVYPAADKSVVSNGAVMHPNTFIMQELIRRYFDETLDREDEGKEVKIPFIYTVSKGTPIPSDLILINEYDCRFSLRPSRGMPLKGLNSSLDQFYDKHAVKETVEEWLDRNPFQTAMADDADEIWMAK